MKFFGSSSAPRAGGSLPLRGAWIEIFRLADGSYQNESLPLRGAWIEITGVMNNVLFPVGRSPCGERGLKLIFLLLLCAPWSSLPLRGAWIEILYH